MDILEFPMFVPNFESLYTPLWGSIYVQKGYPVINLGDES